MQSRPLAIAAFLCVLGTMLAAASPAAAAGNRAPQAQHSSSSLLFVQETQGGELARVRPGIYRLIFRGVAPTVSTFTDRPRRRAGVQELPHFVRDWAANGFAADPPNAALALNGAPKSRDVAMLTLSHPRYDRRAQRLTYTAKPLHGPGDKSLAGFSRRGDPLQPLSFRSASLFVDDAGSDTDVQPIELQVTSTGGDGEVDLQMDSTAPTAYWSLGRPGSSGPGLQVTSVSGPISLSRLNVTPTELSFRTISESNTPTSITLLLYVESPSSLDFLEMTAVIGPSLQLNATLNGVTTTIDSGLVVFPLDGE